MKLPRKEMPAHIVESLAKHMSLQAENHQRQLEAFSVQVKQLNIRIQELNAKKQAMLEKIQEQAERNDNIQRRLEMSDAKVEALEEKFGAQEQKSILEVREKDSIDLKRNEHTIIKDFSELKHEVREHQLQIEALHNHIGIVPVQFTVCYYRQLLNLRKSWYSQPFYPHPQGYKMKLNVDIMGCDEGTDTHVSVYISVMGGEFDDKLKWPFKGRVTIELVDPEEKYNNFVRSISFKNNQKGRLPLGEEHHGLGIPQFISNLTIGNKYLRNNCLHFKISSIDL